MNHRNCVRLAFLFAANLMLCATANAAGAFRAYLASDGNDANGCTLAAPCRLLPAALAAIADGGEIWMLDSANFNTGQVNITKSVSILAIPGAVGSVVATGGGHGIHIDTADISVVLRNLVLVRLGSSVNGINFVQGGRLDVTQCVIGNMQNAGVFASAPNGRLTVTDSILRDNINYAIAMSGSLVAVLDGLRIRNSTNGVYADTGPRITVSSSVISGSFGSAVHVLSNGATTRVVVERSLLTENFYGITAQALAAGVVEITASHNFMTHNPSAGIAASQGAGSLVTVVVDGNTITENGTGILFAAGTPTIYTRGNNTLKFNTPDVSDGTLTLLAGQ